MEENGKKSCIFVCTGNTCRSPMAEVIFNSELRRRRIDDVVCYSAGISAREENINPKSIAVLAQNGFSIENFHSKKLDADALRSAYAIVCMTEEQRDYLMELRWQALKQNGEADIENNVYAFSDICGYDIPDPYGGDVEAYQTTFSRINEAMPPLFEKFFPQKQAGQMSETPPKRKRGRPRKTEAEAKSSASLKRKSTKKRQNA